MWAPQSGEDLQDGSCMYTFQIPNNYVEGHVGDFCLAYYSSRKDCLVGFSDVFKVNIFVQQMHYFNVLHFSLHQMGCYDFNPQFFITCIHVFFLTR